MTRTKLALMFTLASSGLIAACGGSAPTEPPAGTSPAPESKPATPSAAEVPAPPPNVAAPPNTVGPALTPPPGTAATSTDKAGTTGTRATVAEKAPEKPAFTRTDLQVGTGREATKGKGLSAHYTGWLFDSSRPDLKGRMFDSSRDRGPFNFVLGAGQVIPGWDQGFVGMKVGGRRRLIIPPNLAYGVEGAGSGIIPPNATLIFEMELLDVQE